VSYLFSLLATPILRPVSVSLPTPFRLLARVERLKLYPPYVLRPDHHLSEDYVGDEKGNEHHAVDCLHYAENVPNPLRYGVSNMYIY